MLGCFAHARRKYFELNEAQANPIAQEALLRIAELYAIEARGREMPMTERAELRQREAKPLLASMHDWLKATCVTVANGGGTAKAIDYSLKRWEALQRYAENGALPIDINPVHADNGMTRIGIDRHVGIGQIDFQPESTLAGVGQRLGQWIAR